MPCDRICTFHLYVSNSGEGGPPKFEGPHGAATVRCQRCGYVTYLTPGEWLVLMEFGDATETKIDD